jgi:ATP-binding cassette subfamily F protein 3
MPLVSLSGVSVAYGARRLLDGVNLSVAGGARIALVGPNGSGKTTLMRIMTGLLSPDYGSVVREKETAVSYVPQSGAVHEGLPLAEEVEKAFGRGHALLAELTAMEERLGALSQENSEAGPLLERYHTLQERLEASGYWGRAEAISRVLTGLGFRREDFGREASKFSAGWQMRIALAKAILERPDILLLDEPTNYLDLEARTWLEEFLSQYPGGVLVVSHDRYFLDATANAVAEIYLSRVTVFSGNYSRYELIRSAELAAVMERYRLQQEEIARTEAFIRRFRYNASKARQVQSRITALEKLPRIEVPPVAKTIAFSFPPPPASGRMILEARGLSMSYGGEPVFDGLEFDLQKTEKLAVVGPNGAGKSTLLRLLSLREAPERGTLGWGTNVKPAYYSQESSDAWSSEAQVLEEVEAAAPTSLVPELRNLLGAFLFRGDDVYKPVSVLSGGEKSRLSLLLLLLRPANFLILDEPTNHLDLASKDMLLEALRAFPAAVVFVSHDRHFLDGLATAVLEIKDKRSRHFPGGYEYYMRRLTQEGIAGSAPAGAADASAASGAFPRAASAAMASSEAAPTATQAERLEEKRLKTSLRSLERDEEKVLAELEKAESDCRGLEEEMGRPETYSDGGRMKELSQKHGDARRAHAELMTKWEKLCVEISVVKEALEAFRSGRAAR